MNRTVFESKGEYLIGQKGMSKAEFARRMGIQRQNVKSIFKSHNIETIQRVAEVLGVPLADLIGYVEPVDFSEPPFSEPAGISISDSPRAPISNDIQSKIFTFRGIQIIIDRDIAGLYGVETKALNQAVKRNISRFPDRFRFQLNESEKDELVTRCDRFNTLKHSSSLPYAFTEQGVAMLSSVLKSERAIDMSVKIMDAFVAMRRFLTANSVVFQRIESLERHQIETDYRIDKVLDGLETGSLIEKARIFSAGQIYDAKAFISRLIGRSKARVVLVDGYVSALTIDLLDARNEGVPATIYTDSPGASLKALCDQYCRQFPRKPLSIRKWRTEQHDRWLIIDDELWHCGASLKDAGSKTFALDQIGLDVNIILEQV